MRIGLYGGSFDPVHHAHVKLATAAKRELKLSCVYLILSNSPFKKDCKQGPIPERVAGLRRAFKGKKGFHVSLWEVQRRGPSYTAVTVTHFKRKFPRHQLFLILGSDAIKSFKHWKGPRKIVEQAQLAVARRPGALNNLPKTMYGQKIIYLKERFPDVSSREIRQRAAKR